MCLNIYSWAFATSCYYHRRIGITARKLPSGQITIWIRTPTAGFLIPPTTKAPRLTSHVFHAYITVYKRNIAINSSQSSDLANEYHELNLKKKRKYIRSSTIGPLTNTRKAEDNPRMSDAVRQRSRCSDAQPSLSPTSLLKVLSFILKNVFWPKL